MTNDAERLAAQPALDEAQAVYVLAGSPRGPWVGLSELEQVAFAGGVKCLLLVQTSDGRRAAPSAPPPGLGREGAANLNFGEALARAKDGAKVARAGWNGKGMWVAYTPPSEVPLDRPLRGALALRGQEVVRQLATYPSVPSDVVVLRVSGHLDMKAADGTLVIGWLASQTDMLANDWEVVS